MALFEEVSALVPNPIAGDPNVVGPTTTVRSASTTITVKDGQTVVIGGLISDSITARESKVPYISDVPVVGNLFKNTTTTKEKVNLLIFLTPHIVKNEIDAAAVSITERDRFREIMDQQNTPPRLPDPLDKPSFELDGDRSAPGDVAGAPAMIGLADVSVDRGDDGATIGLRINGRPRRFTHQALTHPGRYVIDVFGPTDGAAPPDMIPIVDPLVRGVRVERAEERMRLTVELAMERPPAYALAQHGDTITITLGAARMKDTPPRR
jgi:hypothetical protein